MAYKAFGNTPVTAFRADYRQREDEYYSKGNNFEIHFKISGPLLTNSTAATKAGVTKALQQTAEAGKGYIRPDTPVDTGLLRSRWYSMPVRWNEYRISNDIFYGPFNERRVQMLGRNLGRIQGELNRQLSQEVPRALS